MVRWLGPTILGLLALAGFAMTNPPEDVVSNVSKWWAVTGRHAPPWLLNPQIDMLIYVVSWIAAFAALGLLLSRRYVPRREGGFQQRRVGPVSLIARDVYALRLAAVRLWAKVDPYLIPIGVAIIIIGAVVVGIGFSRLQSTPSPEVAERIDAEFAATKKALAAAQQEIVDLKKATRTPAPLEPMQSAPPPAPLVTELENAKQRAQVAEDARRAAIQSIKSDKERLDAALYEMYDAITREAMPKLNEATYLTHNVHMKLTSVEGYREYLYDIDKLRKEYVKFLLHMSQIIPDYDYYKVELRDGILRGGALPGLPADLDKLKTAVQALPAGSITLETVKLIEPQITALGKAIEAHGKWCGETRELIRKKRDELAKDGK